MGLFSGIVKVASGALGGFATGGVGGAIAGGLGGLSGALSQQDVLNAGNATNATNVQLAQKQMDFQERMSNTSYQRGTKDMEAAGLNPMLAYSQGGASVPSGSLATVSNAMAPAVNSGQAAQQVAATVQKLQADTNLANSEAAVNKVQVAKTIADTQQSTSSASELDARAAQIKALTTQVPLMLDKLKSEVDLNDAQNDKIRSEIPNMLRMSTSDFYGAQADKFRSEIGLNSMQWNKLAAEIQNLKAELPGIQGQSKLLSLSVPRAANLSNAQDSWYMQNVAPYLPDFLSSTSSAAGVARAFK